MTDQAPAPVVDNAAPVQQPAAASLAAPAAAPAAPAGQPPASWYSGFQDESLRGYIETKGFKDPSSLAESYRNLEKLRGVPENELVRIPKEGDAEAWNAYYARMGRPENADGYSLPVPEGDDGAFSKQAAQWMHEAGLTPAQAQILAGKNNEFLATQMKAAQDQQAIESDRQMSELKTEWGQAYDQNTEIARRAAKQFGLDEGMLSSIEEAIGTKQLLTLFNNIGQGLGEHKAHGIGSGDNSFKLSPAAAQERIKQLGNDPEWGKKYLAGGANEAAEMQRLQQMAYPT